MAGYSVHSSNSPKFTPWKWPLKQVQDGQRARCYGGPRINVQIRNVEFIPLYINIILLTSVWRRQKLSPNEYCVMFLYVSICFYDCYVVFGVTRQTFQPTHQPKPHLLQNLCADQHSEPVHQEKPVDSDRLRTATRHVMGEADGTLSMNLGLGHDYIKKKKNYPGCLIADDMLANAWNWEKNANT